jgi:hypothetical protein
VRLSRWCRCATGADQGPFARWVGLGIGHRWTWTRPRRRHALGRARVRLRGRALAELAKGHGPPGTVRAATCRYTCIVDQDDVDELAVMFFNSSDPEPAERDALARYLAASGGDES